jgi:hypothetical protein
VDQSGFHFFQAVRFLPNALDLLDSNVAALQQTDCLQVSPFASAHFDSRMVSVLDQNVAVSFHARRLPVTVMTYRRDSIFLSRVLVNSAFLEPLLGVNFI